MGSKYRKRLFYSVRQDDILEDEDPEARPERVWIKKGARVWHSQATALKGGYTASPKSTNLDQQFSTLSDLSLAALKPTFALRPSAKEQCVLSHYGKDAGDLDQKLATVFLGQIDPITSPLYTDWPSDCLKPQPELEAYLVKVKQNRVQTLRDFIRVFG